MTDEYVNLRVFRTDAERLKMYAVYGDSLADALHRVLDKMESSGAANELIEESRQRIISNIKKG